MMRNNERNFFSQSPSIIESERTSVWRRKIIEDVRSDLGSKDDKEEDVRSLEGFDCYEPSVFNGSTIKSEGSWIRHVDIQSSMNSVPVDLNKDTTKPIPGQIVVSESKEKDSSPKIQSYMNSLPEDLGKDTTEPISDEIVKSKSKGS